MLRRDRIDAPCVLDGPINGQLFLAYVEQFLVPTLSPGDIVIMDDLGSHKDVAVRKAAERTVEATWKRIGNLLNAFPPHQCAKYLRNSGHASA